MTFIRACGVGLVVASGQADAPDDPPGGEEKALRAVEWRVEIARSSTAEADRQRRLRAVEVELAEVEHRARRTAASREHAVRVGLARDRRTGDVSRSPTVDLARLDLEAMRIVRL